MVSTKNFGKFSLTVPSPMRFKKKPSTFNVCVGEKMRGATGNRSAIQEQFKRAAQSC